MSSLCYKCGAMRGVSYKRRCRATLLDIMENKLITPGERLHAADLLVMLLGYGGRNSSGPKRKITTKKALVAEAAKTLVDKTLATRKADRTDGRLRQILQDVSAPASEDDPDSSIS